MIWTINAIADLWQFNRLNSPNAVVQIGDWTKGKMVGTVHLVDCVIYEYR